MDRFVLRRPPRPPLPPSAHDMVREARLQLALAPQGIRLPTIRAVCEDEAVLGVPFYVMDFLEGHVVTDALPPGLETTAPARRLGLDLVDALVEIHAADVERAPPSRSSCGRAATSSGRCGASRSSGRSTGRATSPTSRRSAPGSRARCPSRSRSPSSTATTGSAT